MNNFSYIFFNFINFSHRMCVRKLTAEKMWLINDIIMPCGYSLMAEREISNLSVGVRFPIPALTNYSQYSVIVAQLVERPPVEGKVAGAGPVNHPHEI